MKKIFFKSKQQQQLELKQRDELELISRSGRGLVYIKKTKQKKPHKEWTVVSVLRILPDVGARAQFMSSSS